MTARQLGELVVGYEMTEGGTFTNLTVRGGIPLVTVLGLLKLAEDSAVKGAFIAEELPTAKLKTPPQFATLPGLDRPDPAADRAMEVSGTFQGALASLLDHLGDVHEQRGVPWVSAPAEAVTEAAARILAAKVRQQLASIEHEEGVVDAVAWQLAGGRDEFYATDMEAADREDYRRTARMVVATIREADAS